MNEDLNKENLPIDSLEKIAPKKSKEPLLNRFVRNAFDYLELFACSVFAVLLVFTFGIRLCRVDGDSMEDTLKDKQNLLLYSLAYEPKQDDIVVFHLTTATSNMQKTLVKRVIATENQTVVINTKQTPITLDGVTYEGNSITVDGVRYEDSHAVLKDRITDEITNEYENLFYNNFDYATGIYRVTVPEGKVFVLGDNRNNSKDSRNPDIGFVDERCILGKVVLRIIPFSILA